MISSVHWRLLIQIVFATAGTDQLGWTSRPGEAYSAEERQLFERVAHQVAVALHALRLDAQRKLLEELADGGVTNLPMAQAKAKELIGAAG